MSLQYKGQDVVQAGNSADRAYATASLVSSSLIFTTIGNTTFSINLSNLSGSFSGSFTGTSSFALTSSYSTTLGASLANNSSGQLTLRNSNSSTISTISQLTASLALTASHVTALRAAGSDSQIQYNSGSTFAGTASFTFIYQSQSLQQGNHVTASGLFSHAEGENTQAVGVASHAEGQNTIARGDYSHAEGFNTIASGSHQTVVGTYNVQNNTISEFVVGIGNASTRKDGFTVDADANLSGSIMIPTNTANPSNPKTGSMYYNTSTNRLHIYNGTAWRSSSFF